LGEGKSIPLHRGGKKKGLLGGLCPNAGDSQKTTGKRTLLIASRGEDQALEKEKRKTMDVGKRMMRASSQMSRRVP